MNARARSEVAGADALEELTLNEAILLMCARGTPSRRWPCSRPSARPPAPGPAPCTPSLRFRRSSAAAVASYLEPGRRARGRRVGRPGRADCPHRTPSSLSSPGSSRLWPTAASSSPRSPLCFDGLRRDSPGRVIRRPPLARVDAGALCAAHRTGRDRPKMARRGAGALGSALGQRYPPDSCCRASPLPTPTPVMQRRALRRCWSWSDTRRVRWRLWSRSSAGRGRRWRPATCRPPGGASGRAPSGLPPRAGSTEAWLLHDIARLGEPGSVAERLAVTGRPGGIGAGGRLLRPMPARPPPAGPPCWPRSTDHFAPPRDRPPGRRSRHGDGAGPQRGRRWASGRRTRPAEP